MIDVISNMFRLTTPAKAHGDSWNGSCTFMPYIPKKTFGSATKIVASVKSVIVRFRLLLLIAE